MAILKHLAVKNSDYGDAQRYLLFQHDESGKPKLDQRGNMLPRQGILVDALDCDAFAFNIECAELNRQFHKNQNRKDVKSHHYILSFDPRDSAENGLTPEKVQQIGLDFARYFFEGHQALIVTHPDGNNQAGNLHVHIIINSLRKRDIPWKPFMERPSDAQAGFKHHQTRELLRHMQSWITEVCERERLTIVDFDLPADAKRTNREYHVRRRGQAELDSENAEIIADGLTPSLTEFQTVKDEIRSAIDDAARRAKTESGFIDILKKRHRIELKVSRGAWSFIHPSRDRPIRGRSLGRLYEREEILNRLGREPTRTENLPPAYAALPKVFLIHSDLRLVTDVQKSVKAQQSRAYARKVRLGNLQQIAKSLVYLQNHSYDSIDTLRADRDQAEQKAQTAQKSLRETEAALKDLNEQIHHLGQFLSEKKTYQEFLNAPDWAAFRAEHRDAIERYESSRAFLQNICGDSPFPSMKDLKSRKAKLQHAETTQRTEFNEAKKRRDTLNVVCRNIDTALQRGREEQKRDRGGYEL